MQERGILTVVSGFSGAGKGTVMKMLQELHAEYALSVSATTRTPRPGETDGTDYFFVSHDRFREMAARDELLEFAEYNGNFYGTPRRWAEERLEEGLNVILEIEVQGARKIKEKYPEALLVFVTPPTIAELKKRLTGRGSETPDKIQARLRTAVREASYMSSYDYILINDSLEESVIRLHEIISAEHSRSSRNTDFINKIVKELDELE